MTPAAASTATADSADELSLWWGGGDDDDEFESATAEVTEERDGGVSEVTFEYNAPRGKLVKIEAAGETEYKFASGGERSVTVEMDGFLWFGGSEDYPIDVSAEIVHGGEACSATVHQGDGVVTLCEEDGGEAAYDVSVDAPASATEGDTVTVTGTVENTGDAEGTEDVTVSVDDQSTTESVTLGPGESTSVSLDWQTEQGDAGDYDATASVADQTASTGVTVEPVQQDPGTISGTVTDAENGSAIEGATVTADGATETTDANGDYSLEVDAGDYTVSADADGYQSASQSVSVDAGGTATADLGLTPEEPTPTDGTIEGTVTDAGNGSAIQGATVSAGGASTTTNASGAYSLTVGEGNHTVTASADGYESSSATVTVTAGETTTQELTLQAVDEGFNSFTATGQENGTIALGGNTEDPIRLPECDGHTPQEAHDSANNTWADYCFTIDATINDDGTWTASSSDIQMPWIRTTNAGSADSANVSMSAPNGFSGTIDTDSGEVTLQGDLQIEATIQSLLGTTVCTTSTTLNATTETSGNLTGEPLQFQTGTTANATLVDNQFTVPGLQPSGDFVCGQANGQYGLPAESSGENYFELEFLFEFQK